jgi:hypothetical protein
MKGWKGRNCSEKNCLLLSCLNEGVCTSTYNNLTFQMDYRCACPPGHYGNQCELKGKHASMLFFIISCLNA